MKKFVIVLALLALAVPALAVSPDVVISQVYGGGGNAGGVYRQDFVELFNRSSSPVTISGWSLQYGSATGTSLGSSPTNLFSFPSGSIIQAHSYFLIGMAPGADTTQPALPTVDATGPIAISGTTGKIALLTTTPAPPAYCTNTTIRDLVGWGLTANCFETAPAGIAANSKAVIRLSNTPGYLGDLDTDNNSTDFMVATPVAHNSAFAAVANENQTWGSLKASYR
jgi:hypothetical protein